MKWQTLFRPGYLGKHKETKYQEWNEAYGIGNWRLVWLWGNQAKDFLGACELYETAYLKFLRQHKNLTMELITEASNVYDDSPTNVLSGMDYLKQETNRTHIQDIVIRRALKKLGLQFKGNTLIRIRHNRGEHSFSMLLSPGKVPFHRPELIEKPLLEGWWDRGSVECFYQSNRHLQVRR